MVNFYNFPSIYALNTVLNENNSYWFTGIWQEREELADLIIYVEVSKEEKFDKNKKYYIKENEEYQEYKGNYFKENVTYYTRILPFGLGVIINRLDSLLLYKNDKDKKYYWINNSDNSEDLVFCFYTFNYEDYIWEYYTNFTIPLDSNPIPLEQVFETSIDIDTGSIVEIDPVN